MALHFQVFTDFTLTKGKPQLVKISIVTTTAAVTSFVFYPNKSSYLSTSRIFHTLHDAHDYIAHLRRVYPTHGTCASPALPPLLDSGQIDLFTGVST